MSASATDAELVQAHLAGDGGALAAIYDRYAARLYDTAAALLGDRDEAADVVHDTFLAAVEHLGQLRDPASLRAWLFAVTRHEVERKGRRRRRAVPTAEVGDVPERAEPELTADLEGAELAAIVRAAAAGLDERDQQVLELSLRQGLEGAELAAALGVTPAQGYSLVFRMRERVSRALGALVVARAGRRDCPELAGILGDWDGTFSVLIRKRVARHVDGCDVCARTRAKAALPVLMSTAPAFALPVALRGRVLADAGTEPPPEISFGGNGFPRSRRLPRTLGRPRLVAGVAAAVALAAGIVAVVLATGGDSGSVALTGAATSETTVAETAPTLATGVSAATSVVTSATVSSTAAPTTSLVATTLPVTTPPPTTTEVPTADSPPSPVTDPPPPPPPPEPPPPPPPPPGQLSLATSSISLGAEAGSEAVGVLNAGGQALSWAIGGVSAPFEATGGGVLEPGQAGSLTVSLDRGNLPEGDVAGRVDVTSDSGQATVSISARVERAPEIRRIGFADQAVMVGGCAPRATDVFVNATDESALDVTAMVTHPDGTTSAVPLTLGSSSWSGRVGPLATPGTAQVTIVATDARDNTATAQQSLPVRSC